MVAEGGRGAIRAGAGAAGVLLVLRTTMREATVVVTVLDEEEESMSMALVVDAAVREVVVLAALLSSVFGRGRIVTFPIVSTGDSVWRAAVFFFPFFFFRPEFREFPSAGSEFFWAVMTEDLVGVLEEEVFPSFI